MPTLYINGKFLAQRLTGVQRYASEVLRALDALPLPGEVDLLCPPAASVPVLSQVRVRAVGPAGWPLHAWEQWVLPREARGGLLLNLAGSAPLLAARQACVLHDAAVFECPQAYHPAFVAWYRWAFRRHARHRTALITVSAFSRTRLALALGVPESRLAVVPGAGEHLRAVAADRGVLARHGLEPGGFLLAVGSANPNKNLPRLLAARAALARRHRVPLVLVGGSDARVFAASAGLPPDGDVHALGAVDDATLRALYEAAAALVFPSRYEGFGLPVLEAMSLGCPVIAGRAAALPEVCGDAARLVDPGSEAELASAIEHVLAQPGARAALREAGQARAARFSWPAAARGLLAALSRDPGWP